MSHPPNTRTVWITGAGKGIGRATALRFAAAGWHVAASARTLSDLESLQAAGTGPGTIRPFVLDITDEAMVEDVLGRVEASTGPLDIALLNAGTHEATPLAQFSSAKVRQLLEVNVMGTVNCLTAILPHFCARRSGRIAVVASLAGYRGLPTAAAYGASKAALINLCEALRPEVERAGVGLHLINPGFVETPLTQRNSFPMPCLIPAEVAAERIFAGLQRDRFEIAFPLRFALAMKLLRLLPDRLFFALTRRMLEPR